MINPLITRLNLQCKDNIQTQKKTDRDRHVWQVGIAARDQAVQGHQPIPLDPHPSSPGQTQRSPQWQSASQAQWPGPTRR